METFVVIKTTYIYSLHKIHDFCLLYPVLTVALVLIIEVIITNLGESMGGFIAFYTVVKPWCILFLCSWQWIVYIFSL